MFCHTSLGANEAIEHFPIGRRLAFDAAKGRLWAVCKACERWNLSPIDERWEAIEECEKSFRDTRLRVSTDQIGLAKLKEGTTLIRVGDPQRPEMAAWRYGDQFHRRRRKHLVWYTAGAVAVGGFVVAGPIMGLLGGAGFNLINVPNLILSQRTVARVPLNGAVLKLTPKMLVNVALRPDEEHGFALEFSHGPITGSRFFRMDMPMVELHGDEALRAARHLLPVINEAGGGKRDVASAVGVIESAGGSEGFFDKLATDPRSVAWGPDDDHYTWKTHKFERKGFLSQLPVPIRMALEMSLHEEDERRALEGELLQLEDRWREAEEVAAISDDMFLPPGVNAMLDRLKGNRD